MHHRIPARVPAPRRSVVVSLAVVVALAIAGCSSSGSSSSSSDATASASASRGTSSSGAGAAPTVTKDVLGAVSDPPGAPGRTLTLIRYTIPAGAKLAPHIHPGVQLASITSGDLTYTVVSGTVVVRRAGTTTDARLTGPVTTTLHPGDAVTELDGVVHFGANDTTEPVIIEATLLTDTSRGLSVTEPGVPTTTAPTAPAAASASSGG